MKTFLAVVAAVCMVLAGIGILASIPAESLPLAAASLGGLLLAGILWILVEILQRMQLEQTITEQGSLVSRSPKPELTADELAAVAAARRRRFAMAFVCLVVLGLCAAFVHFH